MRLEEFDAKYSLKYMAGDIQSMKEALKTYADLIRSGEAFEDSYCVAHFEQLGEPLTLDYFREHESLRDYLVGSSPFFNPHMEDIQSSTTGEALFFLCAAMHPELEEDMRKACEAMVDFSRRINDSSEMWLTCESPFGIEALQITATRYPRYGYLLAGFLIPYWDDEHMPEALYALGNWSSKLGITEDTIKAFCYCDNSRARENMLGYDTWEGGYDEAIGDSAFDLLSYFREKPGEYERFKDILVERYEKMPYLQYCDDDRYYEMDPTRSLITDILYLHYPYKTWDEDNHDTDQWLTNRFIESQADEAIGELKTYVEEKLGRPIVSYEGIRTQFAERKAFIEAMSRLKEAKEELSETEKMERLFLEGLPKGEELWRYVIEGTGRESLNETPPLNPGEREEFFKMITGDDSFEDSEEEIDELMGTEVWFLIDDFIEERRNKYSMKNATEFKDNEALRLYDVLHRVMGEPRLQRKILRTLRGTFGGLKDRAEKIIKERYSVSWGKKFWEIVSSVRALDSYWRNPISDQLQELYDLIGENRHEARDMIRKLFEIAPEDSTGRYSYAPRSQRGYLKAGAPTLIGLFILWRDRENGVEDEISRYARVYVEKNAPKIIYRQFTSDAQWPEIEVIDNIEEYTDDSRYQKDYIDKTIAGYELWKPLENYLLSGRFKEKAAEESFTAALSYLRAHLNEDEDDRISRNQPYYESFRDEEECIYYALIAYMYIRVPGLECSGLLERGFRLGLALAPMRMIDLLTTFIPGLKDPLELPEYLKALDELRSMGLSREAYWAVQLQKLSSSLAGSDIDLLKLRGYSSKAEDKAKKYYVRLLKLYTDIVVPKMEIEDPMWLMYEEIVAIQGALIEGSRLLDDSYQAHYIGEAIRIFGEDPRYQVMLDRLAMDKVREEIERNIQTPVNYYKDYLDMAGVAYRTERRVLDDMDTHYFTRLGVESLTDKRYLELKELYEGDESGWVQQCIVKEGEKLKILYNLEALSFAAEAKRRGDRSYVYSFDMVFIDRTCPYIHEEAAPKMSGGASSSHRDENYRKTMMESFEGFLRGRTDFESIRVLLRCAVGKYNFFDGVRRYKGIQIDEIFSKLSRGVQKQVLAILSGVSHEKLDKVVTRKDGDRYIDLMIEDEINPEGLFYYLVNRGKREQLTRLARLRDCTQYIKEAKVSEMVTALAYLGGSMPKYYPLIAELKNNKSIKVREIVEKIIDISGVDIEDPNPYRVVDYGIYAMGRSDNHVEGKEGVTREAHEPWLVEETTEVAAKIGMYIGFRFTVKKPELFPEVCHHSVVVTHPYRDKAGEIGRTQTRWNQNGYSSSKIFLGWYFEEVEELIPGSYIFEVYDTSGGRIAKKEFSVKV